MLWTPASAGVTIMELEMAKLRHLAIAAKDPERTMRRAGWLAALTAALLYIAGTIAFLVILLPARVTALDGFSTLAAAASEALGA